MKILVINAGSTSLKFKLYDKEDLVLGGVFNNNKNKKFEFQDLIADEKIEIEEEEYYESMSFISQWVQKEGNVDRIAFRVVHGGEDFTKPTKIDSEVIKKLKKISELAPLHNPPAIESIIQSIKYWPDTEKFAVFDTEFHSKMPEKAYLYALPYSFYKDYGIRRYGFHGISHEYLTRETAKLISNTEHPNPYASENTYQDDLKIITIHLGGGASITASINGKSIETSMGFTPLEGLMMATRAGDVDDGVYNYMQSTLGFKLSELKEIINFKSGLLGVSEETSDMKTLLELEQKENEGARRAIDLYVYKIQKYIGSYNAILNGVEAITISGAIGSGSPLIRKKIFENLESIGIEVNDSLNDDMYDIKEPIEFGNGKVRLFSMPTDEELMIVRKIKRIQ